MLDIDRALENVLDSSTALNSPNAVVSESGPQNDFVESLTQAFMPNIKKSPSIDEKNAKLIDSMLTADSPETVTERVEKYPAPENCEYVSLTTVNEEIRT